MANQANAITPASASTTMPTNVPTGGGYQCAYCKQWVYGAHNCQYTYPAPSYPTQIVYTVTPLQLQALTEAITLLTEKVQEILELLQNDK